MSVGREGEGEEGTHPCRSDRRLARSALLIRLREIVRDRRDHVDAVGHRRESVDELVALLLSLKVLPRNEPRGLGDGDAVDQAADVLDCRGVQEVPVVVDGVDVDAEAEAAVVAGHGEVDQRLHGLLGLVEAEVGRDGHGETGRFAQRAQVSAPALLGPLHAVVDQDGGHFFRGERVCEGNNRHLQRDFRPDARCGLRDHAERGSAAAADSKEDILVLVAVGCDICPVGKDDLHLHDIVHGEAVGWGKETVAAAGDISARRPNRRASTSHRLESQQTRPSAMRDHIPCNHACGRTHKCRRTAGRRHT